MKRSSKIRLLALLFFITQSYGLMHGQVYVADQVRIIAEDVVRLDGHVLSCCDTIDNRFDVVESKIDALAIEVSCSMIDSIDSKISLLSGCAPMMITAAGYTIAQAGHYCVGDTLSGSSPLITIAASDVLLDLNGNELLASGTAIEVDSVSTRSGIIIHNGFITGARDGAGINCGTTSVGHESVHIHDLTIRNCINGIALTSCKKILLDNIILNDNSQNGLLINGSITACIKAISCHADNNGTGATGDGFRVNNGTAINFTECSASKNLAHGYDIVSTSSICLEQCIAKNNTNTGFKLVAGSGLITECVAIGNGVCGFDDYVSSLVGTSPLVTAVVTPFSYVANSAKANGSNPANSVSTGSLTDTNYCVAGSATRFPLPGTIATLSDANPYIQKLPLSAGSYWDNVTLPNRVTAI